LGVHFVQPNYFSLDLTSKVGGKNVNGEFWLCTGLGRRGRRGMYQKKIILVKNLHWKKDGGANWSGRRGNWNLTTTPRLTKTRFKISPATQSTKKSPRVTTKRIRQTRLSPAESEAHVTKMRGGEFGRSG